LAAASGAGIPEASPNQMSWRLTQLVISGDVGRVIVTSEKPQQRYKSIQILFSYEAVFPAVLLRMFTNRTESLFRT